MAPMAADSALAHERLAARIQAGDPCFNPNLSLADAIPTIALYNGAHPDGAHPDGAHPDGAHPDGAHPDGAHPDTSHPQDAQDAQYARLSMGADDARG